jgi:hypothetical protein
MDELPVEAGVWFRQGCSIIWDPRCLSRIVKDSSEITPISTAMRLSKTNSWPDRLPAANGKAMVVVGLDGCLESLDEGEREKWLKEHVKPLVLSFYRKFQTGASLIFFFERGKSSFIDYMDEAFFWQPTVRTDAAIPIVKFLYGGSSNEIKRIVSETDPSHEPWGLYVANPS